MGPFGGATLGNMLNKYPGLTALDIHKESIHKEGLFAAEWLKKLPLLRRLKFMDCPIGTAGIESLTYGLTTLKHLNVLGFKNAFIGASGAEILAKGFSYWCGLTELDLSGNSLSQTGIRALKGSFSVLTTLKSLNLANNQLRAYGIGDLNGLLESCFTLNCLDLSFNLLRLKGLNLLFSQSTHLTTLSQLKMDSMGIIQISYFRQNGTWEFMDGLAGFTKLKKLSLVNNQMTADAFEKLNKLLKTLTKLEALYLSYTQTQDEGMNHIQSSLKSLTKLKELGFSGNNMGNLGVKTLLLTFPYFKQLKILCLEGNNIGVFKEDIFFSALKKMVFLERLFLGDTGLSEKDIRLFIPLLKDKTMFKKLALLFLDDNLVEDQAVMQDLLDALAQKKSLKKCDLSGMNRALDEALQDIFTRVRWLCGDYDKKETKMNETRLIRL